jgi:hypothetical protein
MVVVTGDYLRGNVIRSPNSFAESLVWLKQARGSKIDNIDLDFLVFSDRF